MRKLGKRMMALVMMLAMVITLLPVTEVKAANVVEQGEIAFGESYSGVSEASTVVYDLKLKESGKVSFNVTYSGDDVWARFAIYDSAENELDYQMIGAGDFTSSKELLAGDYKVKLWSYIESNTFHYSFVADFKPSKETVSEQYTKKNNDVTTATSYQAGTKIRGQLAKNDTTDIYKMVVKKTGVMTITVDNHSIKGLNLRVKDSMGDVNYEQTNIDTGKNTYKYFCPKGTYYITIEELGESTGTYGLKAAMKAGIPAVKLKSVKSQSYGQLMISWSRNSQVDGYEVLYATSKNFKTNANTSTVDGATYANTTVYPEAGKTYYVKVRTFRKTGSGMKYYSKWSKVKSVRVRNR